MRLIDADELIVVGLDSPDCEHQLKFVPLEFIENAETVDAVPVRHGRWMPIYERYEDGDYLIGEKCSECGETLSFKPPFCPYCGAKMDEEAVT